MPLLSFFFAIDTIINSFVYFMVLNLFIDFTKYTSTDFELCVYVESLRQKVKDLFIEIISFFYLEWGNNSVILFKS